MKKILVALLIVAVAGVIAWRIISQTGSAGGGPLTLHGNIDIRDAQLAFPIEERVDRVLVEEGDVVNPGELLATLDKRQLEATVAARTADVQTQRTVAERLANGSRPQEIEQARAVVEVVNVRLANSQRTLTRLLEAGRDGSVSRQELDDAQAAVDQAKAELNQQQQSLKLLELGPRDEDKAEQAARLQQAEAQLRSAQARLADADLRSPGRGVIRARIIEAGETAGPQKPAFTLALIDPKWARVYVGETELGKVRPGQHARVFTDSFPGKPYEGWVGFISPDAEFTPKAVETTELRTALVYEIRVYVQDANSELRLGMPVTVQLDDGAPTTRPTTRAVVGGE